MRRLNAILLWVGLTFGQLVLAQPSERIAPPTETELARPRQLIEEIYPIKDDSTRENILHIIADLRSVADRNDTPPHDKYAIWMKAEDLAIKIGDAGLWESMIDKRLSVFAVDEWTANSEGLIRFAKADPVAFAKNDLVKRALRSALLRSANGQSEQAVTFLEAIRKSSSRIATDRETMQRLADTIGQIKDDVAGDSESQSQVRRTTLNESRPMKRVRLMREKAAPDAVKIGEHYYKAFRKEKITWSDAALECRRMGGYLACLETNDEQQRVVAAIGTPVVLWLGGQILPNGKPMWINGVPVTQSVADQNQKYKYIAFTRDGLLNVRPNSGNAPFFVRHIKGYVCEWDN